MDYKTLRDNCIKSYPSLYRSEGQFLDYLFLTNGIAYDWNNGEPTPRFIEEFKNTENSITAQAIHQAKSFTNDSHDEISFWFDHFLKEFQNHKPMPSAHFSYDYCQLTKIPENITLDWAMAADLCAQWILSIDYETYKNHHWNSICKHFYGAYYECEQQLKKENSELEKYEINQILADKIEFNVNAHLKRTYKNLQLAAQWATDQVHSIHDFPIQNRSFDAVNRITEKPDYYVPSEQREFRWQSKQGEPDKPILETLRHIPSDEEKQKEEYRNKIVDELIKDILDEEK